MDYRDFLGIFIRIFENGKKIKIFEFSLHVPSKYRCHFEFRHYTFTIFLIRYLIIIFINCCFYYILLHFSRALETIFKFKFAATQSMINFVNESREGSCVPFFFSLSLFFSLFRKPFLSIKKKCTCVRYEMHCEKSNYYFIGFS